MATINKNVLKLISDLKFLQFKIYMIILRAFVMKHFNCLQFERNAVPMHSTFLHS